VIVIALKSKHCLTFPSDDLTSLIDVLERAILSLAETNVRDQIFLFTVTKKLTSMNVPVVGCSEHSYNLTKKM